MINWQLVIILIYTEKMLFVVMILCRISPPQAQDTRKGHALIPRDLAQTQQAQIPGRIHLAASCRA